MSKKLILVLFGQDILKIAEANKLYKETWILNVTENGEHFLMHHHMEFYELKSFCLLQNISLCFYCYDFLLVHLIVLLLDQNFVIVCKCNFCCSRREINLLFTLKEDALAKFTLFSYQIEKFVLIKLLSALKEDAPEEFTLFS